MVFAGWLEIKWTVSDLKAPLMAKEDQKEVLEKMG